MTQKTCLEKQNDLKAYLSDDPSLEKLFEKVINLGRSLPAMDATFKTEQNRVQGCQSQMFLHATLKDGKLWFSADSDALISKGLAALLLQVYSGESPDSIFKHPPTFLDELKIFSSLSPGRANGLKSLHLKMQQEAFKLLI